MATVTFPIELGGSGLVVSDDTDPTTGLRNGGYLTRFVPALQQTVAVAGFVVGQVSNAAASASAAAGSASAASSSASSAASSAASAATLYDQFDDRYLGPKASNPTVDNDGNALLVGAMYFNTAALETRVWNGTTWQSAATVGGVVNSLTVTGALEYQGTLTGGTGVINIGGGQIYKAADGKVGFGTATPGVLVDINDPTADIQLRIGGFETANAGRLPTIRFNSRNAANTISTFGSIRLDPENRLLCLMAPASGAPVIDALNITTAGNILVGQNTSSVDSFSFSHVFLSSNGFAVYTNGSPGVPTTLYVGNRGNQAAGRGAAIDIFSAGDGLGANGSRTTARISSFNAAAATRGGVLTFGVENASGVLTEVARAVLTGNLLVGTSIDSGGKLTVGDVTTAQSIDLYKGADNLGDVGKLRFNNAGSINASIVAERDVASGRLMLMKFNVRSDVEAARLTSSRYFKASNSGAYNASTGAFHELRGDGSFVLVADATGAAGTTTGVILAQANGTTDAATYLYLGRNNAATDVFRVLGSGSVQNATNSYGAISDPKLKDIIGPKTSTWEKTKQYNWIEYYLKSDSDHSFKMLGLNAEEAAAVSPGVVDESPDLVEVTKVRQVPVQIVRLDENENPVVDEETGEVIYDEVMVDEEYTEWEPNGEFTKSVKYSVVSMQYHRTTQECQQRIESLEAAKVQADDLIQQIMARVAALESASA